MITICPSCTVAIVDGVEFVDGDPATIADNIEVFGPDQYQYHQPTINDAYPCAICEEPYSGEAHLFVERGTAPGSV